MPECLRLKYSEPLPRSNATLYNLFKAACDIRETVEALAGLASMEGAWPGIDMGRIPLGKLLTEVAGLPFLSARPSHRHSSNDHHDDVRGAGRLLQRALAGLARLVIWDQFTSERPLSIWVVEPLVATERWIVLAATDQIQEAVETPRERLSPLDDRPGRMSMDLPFAGGIVRAHGGQLLALPGGMQGAVVTLPRPNAMSG